MVEKELHVQSVRGVFGGKPRLVVFEKVVLGHHLDVRVVRVDVDGAAERHGDHAVACEEGPPDAFPEAFIGLGELRVLDTTVHA